LTGCWLPAKTFNDGGTLADSYLDLPDGSHDLTVVGTPPTLGASGWVLSGAGALDTGWPIVAGTDSIIVISEHNGASSSSKLLGRRVGTTVELFWLLPAHPTIGLIYAISDNTNTYANQTGPAVTAEAAFGFRGFQPWLNGGDYLSPIAATAPPASILPVYLGGLNEANVLIDSMPAGSTIGAAVAIAGTPSAATMASIEQELWNSMSPGTPPVADFSGTPTTGTVPFTVNFTDLSTADPGVPITAWSWDVDGGGEDYATQNPSHEYTVPGTYTVSLTATNSDGSSTETKVSYITANAAAAEMRLEITNTTRSYRPSFAPVNPDGFFDDFQPLD
jgi:PKD repeat protein